MPINNQKLLLPALIGLSLCGVSAYLVYLLIRSDDEDDNYLPRSAHRRTFEMRVAKDVVAALIGRGGSNIKDIQEKSGCRINFKDENPDDDERICVIRGSADEIHVAELLIKEFLAGIALIEVAEIWVPKTACNRIIGRCGDNITRIMRSSNAKINVATHAESHDETLRKITLKGTSDQISVAKSLIETYVTEDAEIRQNLAQRQPRGPPRISPASSPTPLRKDVATSPITTLKHEKFVENTSQIDGQIEVYVSAVEDPSKFWVQIVGPKATELDQLVEQMTDYYNKEENSALHQLTDISLGEIVAAKFEFDNKWYRAEVRQITPDDKKSEVVELYYVDYGDVGVSNKNEVFELRTDFLRLRFQAIECYLAHVAPVNRQWTEEAIDLFEELTQVAQWKKLWSKVVCYRERPPGDATKESRRRREGSPVPGIQLYDNTKDGDVNVGDELVKAGFAIYEKDGASSTDTSKSRTFDVMKLSNDSMDESNSNLSEVSSISESVDTDNNKTPIPTIKLTNATDTSIDDDLLYMTPAENGNVTVTPSENNNSHVDMNGSGDQLLFNTTTTPSKSSIDHTGFLDNERVNHGGGGGGGGDNYRASSTPIINKQLFE